LQGLWIKTSTWKKTDSTRWYRNYNAETSFLERVEKLIKELPIESLSERNLISLSKLHEEYESGFDYKRIGIHVSIARIFELFNLLKSSKEVGLKDIKLFLFNLYPFASSFSCELWEQIHLRRKEACQPLFSVRWRREDFIELAEEQVFKLMVQIFVTQVNAKFKMNISSEHCLDEESLKKYIEPLKLISSDKPITKVIMNKDKRVINVLTSK
jgi:leucyl-tRNA synthetase